MMMRGGLLGDYHIMRPGEDFPTDDIVRGPAAPGDAGLWQEPEDGRHANPFTGNPLRQVSDQPTGLLSPGGGQDAPPSPVTGLRLQYEAMLGQAKTEQEHKLAWDWYRGQMARLDPQTTLYPDQWKAAFPDKYPAYSGAAVPATGPAVYGRR